VEAGAGRPRVSALLIETDRCPFCSFDRQWLWDKGVPGKFAVCCSNPSCAATGPICATPEQAVVGWNKASRRPRCYRRGDEAYRRALAELGRPERYPGD
jgi:hypothetical protein